MEQEAKLEGKIAAYKAGAHQLSEQQKAMLEDELWQLKLSMAGSGFSKKVERRDWICEVLGVKTGQSSDRAALFRAGAAADPIWDAIAAGELSLPSGYDVLRQARKFFPKSDLAAAVKRVLNKDVAEEVPEPEEDAGARSGRFYLKIRKMIEVNTRQQLEGADEFTVQKIVGDFDKLLAAEFTALGGEIYRLKMRDKKDAIDKIGHTRFKQACQILCIEDASFSKPIDTKLLRNRYKIVLKATHTDHSGTRETEGAYQAVVEAYQVLTQFNQQFEKGK